MATYGYTGTGVVTFAYSRNWQYYVKIEPEEDIDVRELYLYCSYTYIRYLSPAAPKPDDYFQLQGRIWGSDLYTLYQTSLDTITIPYNGYLPGYSIPWGWRKVTFPSNSILYAGNKYFYGVRNTNVPLSDGSIRYKSAPHGTSSYWYAPDPIRDPEYSAASERDYSMYIVYTTSTAPNIASVNGVTSSNIGTINGVSWEDVASINPVE